jgi:adenylosuccinate lyase
MQKKGRFCFSGFMYDYSTYLSPFTWRYGSNEMRALWAEQTTRRLWRRVWVALAQAQAEAGLLTSAELADIAAHQDAIDIAAAHAIEAEVGHDLMAELKVFAGQCPRGGGRLHLGATSMDIEDNAETLRLRQAIDLLAQHGRALLAAFVSLIEKHAATPVQGYTHIQPAEPTTLGYRLCQYAQDLLADLHLLEWTHGQVRGKGIKGAVGTAASYVVLLRGTFMTAQQLEQRVMASLGLEAAPVSTQTYPRKYDLFVLSALASLAQTLHRFALDLRLLQSPAFGELGEPFGARQVGSSAMPFKRNPVLAERICSLARFVAALPGVAWGNAATTMLERTLDDSANRRIVLAEGFLAIDEMLRLAARILGGLRISATAMQRNLALWAPFANTSVLLAEMAVGGGDRQALHEVIRSHALAAWAAVERGASNPLADLLAGDPSVNALLPAKRVREILSAPPDVGDAPALCQRFVASVKASERQDLNQV